jgi:hypothetical protein
MSDKSYQKAVVAVSICALAACAFAAEVVFPTVDMTGQSLNRRITVTSSNAVSVVGTNLAGGVKMVLTPTNGVARTNLLLGDYTATIEGLARAWNFRVHTNGTFSVLDLSNPNQLAWPQSNAVFYTRSEVDGMLASGAGVPDWVVTNHQPTLAVGVLGASTVNVSAQTTLTPDGAVINGASITGGVLRAQSLLLNLTNVFSSAGSWLCGLGITNGAINATGQVHRLEAGGANTLVITNGRVGVGAANPTTSLDVIGNATVYTLNAAADGVIRHLARNQWRSHADGTMSWTKNDGTTKLMSNTNGSLSVPANVIAGGQFTGHGGGLTNLPLATATAQGSLSSNQFSLLSSFRTQRGQQPKPLRGWVTWQFGADGATSNRVWETMNNYDKWGLKDAGFTTIQIDDGALLTTRDGNGKLQCNPTNFNGATSLRPLADYVHSRGYKLGLLVQWPVGNGNNDGQHPWMVPNHRGYEAQDAEQIAVEWDIDSTQTDIMQGSMGYTAAKDAEARYIANQFAIGYRKAAKQFSFKCSFGWNYNGEFYPLSWMPEVLNMGCMGDVVANAQDLQWWYAAKYINPPGQWHGGMTNYFSTAGDLTCHSLYQSLLVFLDKAYTHRGAVNGSGYIADPDRMMTSTWGTYGQSAMNRTDIGMKYMLAAPTIMYWNLDVAAYPYWETYLSPLTNREAIAIQEYGGGVMAERIYSNNLAVVYQKPMGQEIAVAFNNRSTNAAQNFTIYFTNLQGVAANTVAMVRNVWGLTNYGIYTNSFTLNVAAKDTQLLTVKPVGNAQVVGDLAVSGKVTAPFVAAMKREVSLFDCAFYSIEFFEKNQLSDSPILHMPSFRLNTIGDPACYFSIPAPTWATQVVNTIYYQWEGAFPLHWTNRALSVTYDVNAWQFPGSATDHVFTLTNHVTAVRITNWWNDSLTPTMWDKRCMIQQTIAPTNTASRVWVLKILQEAFGVPAAQN